MQLVDRSMREQQTPDLLQPEAQYHAARRYDHRIVRISAVFTIIAAFAVIAQPFLADHGNIFLCLVLLAFCIVMLKIGEGFADPILVFGIVLFLYSFMPQLTSPASNFFLARFGSDGAVSIYTLTIVSYIASCGITAAFIASKRPYFGLPSEQVWKRLVLAGRLGVTISIALSVAFISQHGLVIGGETSYYDSFAVRMQRGTGFFLLSIPFALGGLALLVSTRQKITSWSILFSLFSFVLLYLALGQRKYLLIPFLVLIALKIRLRRWGQIVFWLIIILFTFTIFSYLGFLRTENIPFAEATNSQSIDRFFWQFGANLAGDETIFLYSTVSAAYDGFVQPMKMGGDYTLSWIYALPQFLGGSWFVPLNDRFTQIITPSAAAAGQGYGFAFWGEAYLVGGMFMIPVSCLTVIALFRYLYIRGGGKLFLGFSGAISLSSLYFALWVQRNALAYFVREYLVFQIASISVLIALAKAIFVVARLSSAKSSGSRLAAGEAQ